MYVPEELKTNKFVDVQIPSNKDYFARLGKQSLGESQYTGDDVAPMPTDKVSSISAEEQQLYDEMRQREIDEQRAAQAAAAQASAAKNVKASSGE